MNTKQLIFRGKPVPDHFLRGDDVIGKKGIPLKTSMAKGRHGKPSALKVTITFPEGYYGDYKYHKNTPNCKNERLCVPVHRLKKETLESLNTNYHELGITKDDWERTPEIIKTILNEGGPVIDHHDRNPLNNEITNLKWKTSLGNSSHRKEQLG